VHVHEPNLAMAAIVSDVCQAKKKTTKEVFIIQ